MLVGINAACLIGIVLILGLWFREMDMSPFWALLALGVLGCWIVFFLSTADLLASFYLVIALLAYARGRIWITAGAMALAGLTHETLILMLGGFLLDTILKKRWKEFLILALAILPAGLWNLHLLRVLPPQGSTTGILENLTFPAGGAIHKIVSIVSGVWGLKMLYDGVTFLLITFGLFLLCFAPPPGDARGVVGFCGVVYLLVSMNIFSYYLGFNRNFMNVGLLLVAALSVPSWRGIRVGVLGGYSIATFFFIIAYAVGMI